MRTLPQQSHADLGLVDDDNTEVLKSRTVLVNPGVTSTGEDRSESPTPTRKQVTPS